MEELSHAFFEEGSRVFTEIRGYDHMPPFLVTVVSSSDLWMFLSSLGPLTCGRRSPSGALFPYTTEDKIHDSVGRTGPWTCIAEGEALWSPFDPRGRERFRLERRFAMSTAHDVARFEEVNLDLGLTLRASFEASERYGWVRSVELVNNRDEGRELKLVDGFVNLMPADAHPGLQNNSSVLVDAYRTAERVDELPLALVRLSSIPIDQPRPNESLRANVASTLGLQGARIFMDERLSLIHI